LLSVNLLNSDPLTIDETYSSLLSETSDDFKPLDYEVCLLDYALLLATLVFELELSLLLLLESELLEELSSSDEL
jgi:hypothetical protein